jgi:oligopeptide transport system substrate-binding protein
LGSLWTRPGNFIGNGPFTLKEWQLNKVLKVKKNSLYWNAEQVKLNEIHFFPVDNATREDLMFRAGQLHVTSTVPLEKVPVYTKEYPDLIHIDPYYGTYYLRVNVKKEPFDNKLVRKALSLSIDRKEIVENVSKGGQLPAFSFTPPDPNSYYPPTSLEFNPELARSLLDAARISKEKVPTFELLYNTSEGHQKLAQAIQQMWKENLNIDVQLTNTDWKVYLSRQSIGDYSIARAGWIGDYVDPKTFLDMMVTGRGNNQTGWSNSEYDDLLVKAAQSPSQDERFKNFYKAEKILIDELPIIPIYTYTRIYMLNQDVKGWSPNLLDTHPYQFVYLER